MAESSRTLDFGGWSEGPLSPHYPDAEVHVWIGTLDRDWWQADDLPPDERERAATFLRPEPARRWVAARWGLRVVLGRYLGAEPAAVELVLGESGKPRLRDPASELRFNLSHSGEVSLVAITAGREVGVDVEEVNEGRDVLALAERALPAADAAEIRAAPAELRAAVFHRSWARHEARLKCLGVGLSGTPPNSAVAAVPLELGPTYAAAVAAAGEEPFSLRCWSLGPG
jgi:4'-phosphopantetheinyl transferase